MPRSQKGGPKMMDSWMKNLLHIDDCLIIGPIVVLGLKMLISNICHWGHPVLRPVAFGKMVLDTIRPIRIQLIAIGIYRLYSIYSFFCRGGPQKWSIFAGRRSRHAAG